MKKLLQLWGMSLVLVGWVYLMDKLIGGNWNQRYLIAFGVAPLVEELFFRWLPVQFGKRLNAHRELCLISTLLFIWWHVGNYPIFGWYYAALFQGSLGYVAYVVCKKYGYWASVLIHIKYNLFIFFILN